jgi:predicted CoA-binding protein
MTDADPLQLLRETRTIAMVGASPNAAKPSHGVMRYLLHAGYRVVPVRADGCAEVLGVPCVAALAEIDEPIDMVDVFRRPEFCADHAREAVEAGAKSLWLQLGIRSPEARRIAQEAGLAYVENACTAALHRAHLR